MGCAVSEVKRLGGGVPSPSVHTKSTFFSAADLLIQRLYGEATPQHACANACGCWSHTHAPLLPLQAPWFQRLTRILPIAHHFVKLQEARATASPRDRAEALASPPGEQLLPEEELREVREFRAFSPLYFLLC